MTRTYAILAAAAVVIGLGASTLWVLWPRPADRFAQCRESVIAGGAGAIGGPFALTGADGVRRTDADIITKPTLLYFGYAFCPDVCPMDNERNAEAVDLLAAQGHDVQPVFISIDPERDTPEVVADFTDYDNDLTFNVGTILGGTVINRVPHQAAASVEMRAFTPDVFEGGVDKMLALNDFCNPN